MHILSFQMLNDSCQIRHIYWNCNCIPFFFFYSLVLDYGFFQDTWKDWSHIHLPNCIAGIFGSRWKNTYI